MKWKKGIVFDLCDINPENISRNYPFDFIRYFDISSVGSGVVSINNEIPLSEAPTRAKRVVRDNDTIIATVRPGNKSYYYFKSAFENSIASTGFAVLRPKQNIADPRFLYYLISETRFTAYLVAYEQGANYPAVNPNIIGEKPIEFPPLPIQRRIASILSAYDDLIENNLKRIKLLEEMAFLRYKQIVREEKLEKHILSEFGDIITGKTPSTVIADNFGDDVPFIKTPDMHNQIFVEHTDQMLSELGAKSQEKKFIPPLSLCVSYIGTAGVVGITSKPSQTNEQINSIVFYDPKNVYFFYALMSHMKEQT